MIRFHSTRDLLRPLLSEESLQIFLLFNLAFDILYVDFTDEFLEFLHSNRLLIHSFICTCVR